MDIDSYRRDGVIKLEQAFDPHWLATLHAGIDRDLADLSERLEQRTAEGSTARYCENYWAWSDIPEFEDFLRNSPAAMLAGKLLNAQRINLVMDNWFLREAGCAARAPWHHDIAYFDFEGTMCVLWLPLESIGSGEGIEFVRGSHRWNKLFMRVYFDSHQCALPAGTVNGLHYDAPPDIDAHRDDFDIVSFDLAAGDCLLFDIRTLHGSPPNFIPRTEQRRFTVRMAAEDARIRYRGSWAAQERAYFEAAGHREGDSLNSDFFPTLWASDSSRETRNRRRPYASARSQRRSHPTPGR